MTDAGKEAELAGVTRSIIRVEGDLEELYGERDVERAHIKEALKTAERTEAEADQETLRRMQQNLDKIETKIEKKEELLTELLKKEARLEGAAAGGAPAAGTCCTHPPSCLSFPHLWRTAERQFAKRMVCVQGWDNLTHALCGDA